MNLARNFAKKVFGTSNISSLNSYDGFFVKRFKIVVFSPKPKIDKIISSMASAGAGEIGHYTHCSFRSSGSGTFKGDETTSPVVGTKERFESADEVRIEMICDEEYLSDSISAMLKTHPYEEPAFDIYEVFTSDKELRKNVYQISLKKPVVLKNIIRKLNYKLKTEIIESTAGIKVKEIILNLSGMSGFIPNNPGIDIIITKLKNSYTFEINKSKEK